MNQIKLFFLLNGIFFNNISSMIETKDLEEQNTLNEEEPISAMEIMNRTYKLKETVWINLIIKKGLLWYFKPKHCFMHTQNTEGSKNSEIEFYKNKFKLQKILLREINNYLTEDSIEDFKENLLEVESTMLEISEVIDEVNELTKLTKKYNDNNNQNVKMYLELNIRLPTI